MPLLICDQIRICVSVDASFQAMLAKNGEIATSVRKRHATGNFHHILQRVDPQKVPSDPKNT